MNRPLCLALSCIGLLLTLVPLFPTDPTPQPPATAIGAAARAAAEPTRLAPGERIAAVTAIGALPYGAPVGTRFLSTLVARHRTALTNHDGSAATLEFIIDGNMQQTVVARRSGEMLLAVSFPNCRVTVRANDRIDDAAGDALSTDLAAATLVRMQDNGTRLSYGFAPGVQVGHRNWIRTLIAATHCAAPMAAPTAWEQDEIDASGRCTVRYRIDARTADGEPATLVRERLRWHGDDADPAMTIPTLTATTKFELDADARWVATAEHDERLVAVGNDGAVTATQSGTIAARLTGQAATATEALVADWDACTAPLAGHDDAAAATAASEEQRYRHQLAGRDAAGLFAEVVAMVTGPDVDRVALLGLRMLLAWLLRLDDRALPDLVANVQRLPADHPALLACLEAMALAGTTPAQDRLAAMLADQGADGAFRTAVLLALHSLQTPTPRTLDAVQRLVVGDPGTEQARTAMLTAGTLAGRDRAGNARPALLALATWAEDHGMTETWLLALANTGGDFPVAEILPFTTHRDGGVRGAAMLALGRSTTEAALQALGVALRTDVDPTVRGCAAEALARQASETATTELERGLNSEPVRDVRLTAIDELSVRARRWPGAARLLRWLADHDPDQDVRAAARDALARS